MAHPFLNLEEKTISTLICRRFLRTMVAGRQQEVRIVKAKSGNIVTYERLLSHIYTAYL